ncbi:hypothetical protein [Leisingera sp. XS_AS12]|uniref:DUF6902 family protein n=1 Tax=Leisingera sp. XS_AS12 TaxID=3241294 RepID=UPI003511DE2D
MAQIIPLSVQPSGPAFHGGRTGFARGSIGGGSSPQRALVAAFARGRRREEDVFWLKENAELLNILQCTGHRFADDSLAVLAPFYAAAPRHLSFFRQYYRFILSICLDLEDLGMEGESGAQMAQWVARQELVQAELSDLQRAEARRLLERRDVQLADAGLDDRLRGFASRSQTFAIPNKKAAYELTHIVFYLSEYGQRDPDLPAQVKTSLEYAGLVAFLDQDADLLAEICIALRYAGHPPPLQWEAWLDRALTEFSLAKGEFYGVNDDYHAYFVMNWLMVLSGRRGFRHPVPRTVGPATAGGEAGARGGGVSRGLLVSGPQGGSVLKHLSEAVFKAGETRPHWPSIKSRCQSALTPQAQQVLRSAEQSCADFDGFFECFARAGHAAPA